MKIVNVLLLFILFWSSALSQQYSDANAVRSQIREFEQSRFSAQSDLLAKTPTPNQTQFDIIHYRLNLGVDPGAHMLTGAVTIAGKSHVNGLGLTEIDLFSNMLVDSVTVPGGNLSFTHEQDLLTVNLAGTVNENELFEFTVHYSGDPQPGGLGTWGWDSHGNPPAPIVWTLSEPFGAPAWWPCKDDPNDKADSVFVSVTVADTLVVASNGLLTDVTSADGKSTYHWESFYPISTYLVSLAISNYEEITDWYVHSENDSMLVQHFVYPEKLAAAQADFPVTVDMIAAFAGYFGEYPFLNEKYGMALFPWGGAMEHQTMTSMGAQLVTGTHYADWINAHELAHQWFGDCVTMRRWSHIWLNEGFASYAEALWAEAEGGNSAYHDYMLSQDPGAFMGSLFVVDSTSSSALFSNTVYDKGSWALHMLRGVLGDSLFFAGLRTYASAPETKYGTATSEMLRDIFESVSGQELNWFFDQWVYRSGRPNYIFNWSVQNDTAPYETRLNLYQDNQPWKMPLQVRLQSGSLDTTITIWDSLAVQEFVFTTNVRPTFLEIDPDNWVLKNITEGELYSISGHVRNLADSSAISGAMVVWQGPFDPATGAPLNFGYDSTSADGSFQFNRSPGIYTLQAGTMEHLPSELLIFEVNGTTAGLDIYLSQPQPQLSIDSLYLDLSNGAAHDTALVAENNGSGEYLLQLIEGNFAGLPDKAEKPALTISYPMPGEQLKNFPVSSLGAGKTSNTDWMLLYEDPQENPDNPFDLASIEVQKSFLNIYFRFKLHQQPTSISNLRINLFIDSDDNYLTGGLMNGMGVDHLIAVGNFGQGNTAYLLEYSAGNYVLIGQVDTYSANLLDGTITVSLRGNRIGNPENISLMTSGFDTADIMFTLDYMPGENLGYLSASLTDISWLQSDRLFAHVSTASAEQIMISVDPADLASGFYQSGFTLFTSSPLGMDRHFLPISFDFVTTIADQPLIPKQFEVGQNYPNPFNPTTTIPVALPTAALVSARIYNILGQEVYRADKQLSAGLHYLVWSGRTGSGDAASSGIYFYRISNGDETMLKKMVLVR